MPRTALLALTAVLLSGCGAAEDAARGLRDRWSVPSSAVVAVEAAPTVDGAAAALDQLRAVRPTSSVLLVDAGTRERDLRARIAALAPAGGPTWLAATGVHATAEPGALLALGVPVAMLDGAPATAGAWSGVLVDALARTRGGAR